MRNVQGTATPVFKTKTKTKTDDLKHDDDGKEHSDSLTKDKSSDVQPKAPLRKLTTLPKPAQLTETETESTNTPYTSSELESILKSARDRAINSQATTVLFGGQTDSEVGGEGDRENEVVDEQIAK